VLVCVCSTKGSPGASVTALALAAVWPTAATGRKVVLAEADPDGGSLVTRWGLGRDPGLVSLAAAGRHGLAPDALWDHSQDLPGGLAVVPALDDPARAAATLRSCGPALAAWLAGLSEVDVIVDAGRIWNPLTQPLRDHADRVLLVARPSADQLLPAAPTAAANANTRWLLVGNAPYRPGEVTAATGVGVAAVFPEDRRAAAALTGAARPRGFARLPLIRAAASLAGELTAPAPTSSEGAAADPPGERLRSRPRPVAEAKPAALIGAGR
jgi:hypothetical protein